MIVLSETETVPSTLDREPVRAAQLEQPALQSVAKMFLAVERQASESHQAMRTPALVGPDGEHIDLPDSAYQVLRRAVEHLRRGEGVVITRADDELTTQQAADVLNISRPYLVRLLEGNHLPFHRVGTHRRIRRDDVMAYKRERDQQRRARLRQMVHEAEDAGLYDVPEALAQ